MRQFLGSVCVVDADLKRPECHSESRCPIFSAKKVNF